MRGQLMQQLPTGSLPFLPEAEVKALLDEKIILAASNGPKKLMRAGDT